jgi:hypothetical protein
MNVFFANLGCSFCDFCVRKSGCWISVQNPAANPSRRESLAIT